MATIISNQQIWSNPSRNIKVDATYQNRTATTIQVNVTTTYTLNTSGGYSGYSAYFTPTINNVKQSRVQLKKASPSSWYGSPISKSSGWKTIKVNKNTTSIPISVLFETDDPADNDVTKSGNLSIPRFITNSRINLDGNWIDGDFYINVSGSWKKVTPYVNVNGSWKKIK